MARTFYRVVMTDPPRLIDFTSNAGKGKVLRRPNPDVGVMARRSVILVRQRASFHCTAMLDDGPNISILVRT
jgi:hypothetical protein